MCAIAPSHLICSEEPTNCLRRFVVSRENLNVRVCIAARKTRRDVSRVAQVVALTSNDVVNRGDHQRCVLGKTGWPRLLLLNSPKLVMDPIDLRFHREAIQYAGELCFFSGLAQRQLERFTDKIEYAL